MRKSARTQIPPFFDNDPYRLIMFHGHTLLKLIRAYFHERFQRSPCICLRKRYNGPRTLFFLILSN